MKFQSPRGMADRLPADQPVWRFVEDTACEVATRYGYERIDTPVVESTGLFQRGVGDDTDIVDKEMYSFEDRGGES
jgi:histidyl-tRNA synthetase